MTALLCVLAVLAIVGGYATVVTAWDRHRSRYDDHARIYARDYAPAEHRSLAVSLPACAHPTRPVSVVPHGHTTPEAWICPDCYATVPEPAPLGPPPVRVADDGRFLTVDARRGFIAAGTIAASKIATGSFTLGADGLRGPAGVIGPAGPRSLLDDLHGMRSALDRARERALALSREFSLDGRGNFTITKDQRAAYSAACESVKEIRAQIDAYESGPFPHAPDPDPDPDPEPETYEVFSHQSATPVRTFTTGGRERPDFRRTNLATFMRESGHTEAYIAEQLAEWDRRQTTAEPARMQTGRGWPIDPTDDTRPLTGYADLLDHTTPEAYAYRETARQETRP